MTTLSNPRNMCTHGQDCFKHALGQLCMAYGIGQKHVNLCYDKRGKLQMHRRFGSAREAIAHYRAIVERVSRGDGRNTSDEAQLIYGDSTVHWLVCDVLVNECATYAEEDIVPAYLDSFPRR